MIKSGMKLWYDKKSKDPTYLGSFFNQITADSKFTFEPNTVNRFMIFARILCPDSKLGTYNHLNHYYEQPSFSYNHIMRTMDLMAQHYDEYLTHNNKIMIDKRYRNIV